MSVAEFEDVTGDPASSFEHLAASEETLVEVLARLERAGVDGKLVVEPDAIPPGVRCDACGRRHLPRRLAVIEVYRFEGPSSPDDEAIAVVVECPVCRGRGALVSAYGPASTRAEAEVLTGLGAAYERTFRANG